MTYRPLATARAAAAVAAGLALALGAVACNDTETSGGSAAPAASAPVAAASAPASAAAEPRPAGAAAATTAGATAKASGSKAPAGTTTRCHTGDLKAEVQVQPDGGKAMVMLTNTGSRTCTVKGYLGYGGLLADNSRVDTATKRVAQPGPPVSVTLKPGTTAFSGLAWESCDKADPTCHVLAGVVVTPPDETTQLTADLLGTDGQQAAQLLVSAAGFTVGTLQPSNQGVLLG